MTRRTVLVKRPRRSTELEQDLRTPSGRPLPW